MKIKILLFGVIVALSATFNASAMDDGCNQAAREPNATVSKYNMTTSTWQYDVWRLNCDTTTQILIKLFPGEGQQSSESPGGVMYCIMILLFPKMGRSWQNKNYSVATLP